MANAAELPDISTVLIGSDLTLLQAAADAELQAWRTSEVERQVDAMRGDAIRAMRRRIAAEQRRCQAMAEACQVAQRAIGSALTKGVSG